MDEDRRAVIGWSGGVSAAAGTFAGVLASRTTTPLSQNALFISCVAVALITFAILLMAGMPDLLRWFHGARPEQPSPATATGQPLKRDAKQQATPTSGGARRGATAVEARVEPSTAPRPTTAPLTAALTTFAFTALLVLVDLAVINADKSRHTPTLSSYLLIGAVSGGGIGLPLSLLEGLSASNLRIGRSVAVCIVVIFALVISILLGGAALLGVAAALVTVAACPLLWGANHIGHVIALIRYRRAAQAAKRASVSAGLASANAGYWRLGLRQAAALAAERARIASSHAESERLTAAAAGGRAAARTAVVTAALRSTSQAVSAPDEAAIASGALGSAFATVVGAGVAGVPGVCVTLTAIAGVAFCFFASLG